LDVLCSGPSPNDVVLTTYCFCGVLRLRRSLRGERWHHRPARQRSRQRRLSLLRLRDEAVGDSRRTHYSLQKGSHAHAGTGCRPSWRAARWRCSRAGSSPGSGTASPIPSINQPSRARSRSSSPTAATRSRPTHECCSRRMSTGATSLATTRTSSSALAVAPRRRVLSAGKWLVYAAIVLAGLIALPAGAERPAGGPSPMSFATSLSSPFRFVSHWRLTGASCSAGAGSPVSCAWRSSSSSASCSAVAVTFAHA